MIIKVAVLIITHLNYAVFNPESITKVLAGAVVFNFDAPIFNVLTIKKFGPTSIGIAAVDVFCACAG